MRNDYLSKLIFYLKETRDLIRTNLLTLRSLRNYLEATFNKQSATDVSNLKSLELLIDKLDYAAKYYDVCVDFYEDK